MAALYDIARAIWRETYRHDTLLEWHEIRVGTLHYKRTIAAAEAVQRELETARISTGKGIGT